MLLLERQRARDGRSTGIKVVLIKLFLLVGSVHSSYAGFTCAGGYVSCPDKNVQAASSGGRVHAMVYGATNLPDQDLFKESGLSDPYIQIEVGSTVTTSSVLEETLNPVWLEEIDLGFHNSGDIVSITILDADSGFELGDDVLYSTQVRVPWCSAFHADVVTAKCEDGYNYECDVQDTAWSMPTQPFCNETSWVYLGGASNGVGGESGCNVNDNYYSCLKLGFSIVPFQVEVSKTYSNHPFDVTVAGFDTSFACNPAYDDYGIVYNDRAQRLGYDTSRTMFDGLRGGIMVRTNSDEAGTVGGGKVVDFAINAESTVWICKWNEDTIAFGDPSWLKDDGWEQKPTVRAYLNGHLDSTEYFACWSKHFPGTERNYWGGLESEPVTLFANGVDGREEWMYIVIIVPEVDNQVSSTTYSYPSTTLSSVVVSTAFWSRLLEHIFAGAFFTLISYKFLKDKDFRVGLIEVHLMQMAVESGKQRSVLWFLLASHGKTEKNAEFRRNLCLAAFATRLSLLVPIFVLWAWGLAAIITVNPPAVGFFLCFVGTSCAMGWFGFNHWRARRWMMDSLSLCSILSSVLLVLAFLASVVFVDPSAVFASEDLDFRGLTGTFLTLDMLPFVFLLFSNDAKLTRLVNKLGNAIGEVTRPEEMKSTNTTQLTSPTLKRTLSEETIPNIGDAEMTRPLINKDTDNRKGELMSNNPYYSVLGDCCTILASTETFRLTNIPDTLAASPPTKKRRNRCLYGLSLAFLVLYLAISAARTKYGHLALLNTITLLVLDSCHFSINRRFTYWSPGYGILLMGTARVAMMFFMAELWIVGYSIAFVVYGGALIYEVVTHLLPRLSKEEVRTIVFLGHEPKGKKCDDVAANPEVVLGYTCLYFIVLIILAYGEPATLPLPTVPVLGQQWPALIFTLAGILLVMSIGFFVAWLRCLFLGKQGLLPVRLDAAYFWIHSLRLPVILAAATSLSVLCIGLLVWAATGSSAEFKVCLCLPAIVFLSLATYSRWVKNDYALVNWPPDAEKDKAADIKMAGEEGDDDPPDTAQVAAGVLGDLFRPEDFYDTFGNGGASETVGSERSDVILPEFRLIGDAFGGKLQIPVLPLKSALQRTRAAQQSQAARPEGTNDMIDTGVNEDVNGGEDESNASSFAEVEPLAMVRPKYVRRNGRVQLGFWVRVGETISKITSGEGPACAIWRRAYRKKRLKIGPTEHDEGDRDGSPEHEALPGKVGIEIDVEQEQGEVRVDSISFRRAFLEGYLLPHEYRACYGFAACLSLIVVMGLLLSREEPGWFGHLLWAWTLVAMFTFLPAAKWFGTYEVDSGMKISLWLAGMILTTSCVLMFLVVLDGDAFQDQSLAVLNGFLSYPIIAYGIFSVFQVIDGPTPSKAINVVGHLNGEVYKSSRLFDAFCYTIGHLLTFKFLLAVVTPLWLLQSFFWGGLYLECALTIVVVVAALAGRIVQDYKSRCSFASRSFSVIGMVRIVTGAIMVACLVTALLGVGAVAFCLTAFFLVWIMRIAMSVAMRSMEVEADIIVYFAPWVFPAFTYNTRTGNLVDVTPIACQVFSGILIGVAWGITLTIFVEPLGLGVVITCVFLIALASAAAWCLSWTPNQLGVAAQFLDSSLVVEAGDIVRASFIARHAVFQVDCPEYFGRSNIQDFDSGTGSAFDAVRTHETRKSAFDLAVGLEEKKKRLRMVLEEETQSYRRRFDALYSLRDAILEAFVSGKGPFGPIGLYGLWFGILRFLALLRRTWCPRRFGKGYNTLVAQFFPDGQRRDAHGLSPPLNHPEIMLEILDEERALQMAFRDELMCMMHFQILLLLSAEARLQREGVLFRKFFKDNHFKLLSNRIVPPKAIFSNSSFASVDIPMVAVWLSGLTGEERMRFQMLRRQFSEIQSDRDVAIMRADEAREHTAKVLEKDSKSRGKAKSEKQRKDFVKRRIERTDAWAEQLSVQDQQAFTGLRAQWLKHDNAAVHPTNLNLRESFEKAVLLDGGEVEANARETLENIESGKRGCRPGSYGRRFQFVDPVFPPDNDSVGEVQCRRQLASRWKVSLSANPDIRLFDEGTDPAKVRRGVFADTWLLSALSMISGATVGDGAVNEQIAQLFVSPIGGDGRPVFESSTGAHAVKIMICGEWQVVIVDDFFPAIESIKANDDNKGLAVGHSYGFRQLWVSLLEKAYAKFYGSYAALETGFVHHALTAFTGAQSEEILLARAGRGAGKKGLWKKMVRYRRNGYIMGAGTVEGNLVERQVQDIGLVFGATYTILEVLNSDGEWLIKLRHPPGDHEEWRGDWGNHSPLWTRRRRRRLGFENNGRDNAFWMSFNDFCVMFRSLYVCRWYDPRKWTRFEYSGSWEVREDLDTAAGLPSAQQNECELENNPQFTLDVEHPTDIKISLIQTDEEVQPASCIVFRKDRPRGRPSDASRRVSKLSREVVIASSGPPIQERERNVYVTLGTGVYIVMCAAFMAGMEGSFKVKIIANSRHLKFSKLWPPANPGELAKTFDDSKMAGYAAVKVATTGSRIGKKQNNNADKWAQEETQGGGYAKKEKATKKLQRSSTMP